MRCCSLLQIGNPMDTLVVRVINNVNKKMEVKPKFLEAFRNEGFPDSFPYRQKVRCPHLLMQANRPLAFGCTQVLRMLVARRVIFITYFLTLT